MMKRRRIWHADQRSLVTETEKPKDDSLHPKDRRSFWCTTSRFQVALIIGLLALTFVALLSYSSSNLLWGTKSSSVSSRRFPNYGSAAFAQQCNWTTRTTDQDCTFVVRPSPDGFEGIAQWIAEIASAHILAKQTRCPLLLDYGDDVDIHQVLKPLSMNWTIPYGFQCSHHCVNVSSKQLVFLNPSRFPKEIGKTIGRKAVNVPYYRRSGLYTKKKHFDELQQELPGFDLKSGMACSLGSLFDLAPTAAQFEPELFTRILPTLRDETALVMTIYYRSGYTDKLAMAEKTGHVADEITDPLIRGVMPCVQCALDLERKYLSTGGMSLSRSVWMVATDSTYLKKWIREAYNSQQQQDGERVSVNHPKLPREIVTTTSRGKHTRTSRNPSTVDFAQALIDWYLIGESDLVITNSDHFTFGWIGALRTVRPFYLPDNCSKTSVFADLK